ncbi:MAG: hypothetical protein IPH91_10760 [Elusimicrobia bacterium]|nr:hypothetical protein [Elusimicrobiota bacterium]
MAAAGVPFEIVPGVSSVTAVPAHAGVPLTHRDFTSTVTVVTGHGQAPNRYWRESASRPARPAVDWKALPRDGTLVVLMGLKNAATIAADLLRAGWAPDTPSLAVASGTLPEQKTVRAPLAEFGAACGARGCRPRGSWCSAGWRAWAPSWIGFRAGRSLAKRFSWRDRPNRPAR